MDTLKKEIEGKEPNRRIFRTPQKQEDYLRPTVKEKNR
jgi:hypothetical protein